MNEAELSSDHSFVFALGVGEDLTHGQPILARPIPDSQIQPLAFAAAVEGAGSRLDVCEACAPETAASQDTQFSAAFAAAFLRMRSPERSGLHRKNVRVIPVECSLDARSRFGAPTVDSFVTLLDPGRDDDAGAISERRFDVAGGFKEAEAFAFARGG